VARSASLRIKLPQTIEETRAWATAVLSRGLDFDDLDGGQRTRSELRSLLHGEHPARAGPFEDTGRRAALSLSEKLRQVQQEQGSLSGHLRDRSHSESGREASNGACWKRESFATRVIKAAKPNDPSDPSPAPSNHGTVKGLDSIKMSHPRAR